jgi:hypothetical protein
LRGRVLEGEVDEFAGGVLVGEAALGLSRTGFRGDWVSRVLDSVSVSRSATVGLTEATRRHLI